MNVFDWKQYFIYNAFYIIIIIQYIRYMQFYFSITTEGNWQKLKGGCHCKGFRPSSSLIGSLWNSLIFFSPTFTSQIPHLWALDFKNRSYWSRPIELTWLFFFSFFIAQDFQILLKIYCRPYIQKVLHAQNSSALFWRNMKKIIAIKYFMLVLLASRVGVNSQNEDTDRWRCFCRG